MCSRQADLCDLVLTRCESLDLLSLLALYHVHLPQLLLKLSLVVLLRVHLRS